MTDGISNVHMQVMWNRLISVVEEQALTLLRTAFSTSVREAGDLSAGVFDEQGHMIAQAVTGTPGHVNAMAEAVGHFIDEIGGDNIFEGDSYITNDPWKGTGHLHDFTFVNPSFRNGRLVGYFACTAHVVDVGGRGFGPDATEVYEEGIVIPIMKFAERGEVDQRLIKIIRGNVRESGQVIGDLYSLSSCNDTGHQRLMDMMDEFRLDDLNELRDFVFSNSLNATMEHLRDLPAGSYENEMTVDGYDAPVTMKLRLDVSDQGVLADFAGTSGLSRKGINVPLVYTTAYACYALKCALAPQIPNNHASLSPFKVTAPENCILNAKHPAPVAIRHVLGQFLPDVVLGALHKMLPDRVPAEGASALWIVQLGARPIENGQAAAGEAMRNSEILMFNSGGTGARPTLDGLSATAFPSGVHTMSAEVTEHVGPITIWRKELREGSGGAGARRGGLGQVIELSANPGHRIYINAMFDRCQNPARGRNGGHPGAAGSVELDDGSKLSSKGKQWIPDERRLVLKLPGGGGYGDPSQRDPALVAQDVEREYITPDQAKRDYAREN
ncbi:MAG: hydantoinase B/oxoprolinase family protein [Gammaproteobacteria bacterium]|nr:hydantoinase B/oxoprolinase family protein [Gammaproteobacteria bacterium]MDH3537245.1 hydantoinase B/oxoprolinase family protein [Gammaproteobacteria bacterium]